MFETLNAWVGSELASASGAQSFLYLALGGALASLLPCVYPLYPITAAILRERQSRLGRFAHPLAYYAGLCLTYFAFGLIASVAGGAFNTVLRLPVANLLIGVSLLLLALSTVGLLHFPMLVLEDRQGAGLVTTVVMGAGAGLLSSACVGPVVVSVLVQLAANTAQLDASMALLAAAKMAAFGMGVGSPLLVIGLLGIALPRGGSWMVYVQWLFGLLIGYFAVGYLNKALSGYGFSERAAQATLAGVTMIGVAAFARSSSEQAPSERTRAALMAVLGVVGFFVVGRGMLELSPHLPTAEAQTAPEAASSMEAHGPLRWHLDKDAAYAEALRTGRPVFVDFHGNWCSNCKAFQERTQDDAQLRTALQNAVLLKVYDSSPLFAAYRDDTRFPELKVGLPFFVITDAKGELLYKTSDFTNTGEMALFLAD
ncbi:MAG TPA: cytochrome c biogenesis protein CcdA [Polyangiales bacterium]